MIDFLHHYEPEPVLWSAGPITIYWYGLLMVLAISAALGLTILLARRHRLSTELIFDLSFWLIIGGIIGARIYEVFLQLPYYLSNPGQIPAVWNGGLAIHGGILAGLGIIWHFSRRHNLDYWRLAGLVAPGLALGQAIGRFGNYFNQEIFGLPTDLPWGIPIALANRPWLYASHTHFHPVFLYESAGCLIIALLLTAGQVYLSQKGEWRRRHGLWSVGFYMLTYSILRFGLEVIRLDDAPLVFGQRWPQIVSWLMAIAAVVLIFNAHDKKENRRAS